MNHSTRLNCTRPIISPPSFLEKRKVKTRVRHGLRQSIYNRLRNLNWERYAVVVVVSYQVESEQNPELLYNLTVMRKLNLNPLIRMISRYKICDYGMIKSPHLVFY